VLNFSKINTLTIYLIFFLISVFAFLNFQKKDDLFIDKKINLGLDLQGGSYLLLEINSDTLIQEKIQDKVIPIKKLLKKNNINYSNFKINNLSLSVNINDLDKFDLLFNSRKDNLVNPYIDNYRSFELEYKKISNE
jgi:preprotein translocase subunit SecD